MKKKKLSILILKLKEKIDSLNSLLEIYEKRDKKRKKLKIYILNQA